MCRHPGHPSAFPRLYLARHDHCPACADIGVAQVFEYGTCRRCGAGYAVGSQQDDGKGVLRLIQSGPDSDNLVCLAFAALRGEWEDEDETAAEGDLESSGQRRPTVSLRGMRCVRRHCVAGLWLLGHFIREGDTCPNQRLRRATR